MSEPIYVKLSDLEPGDFFRHKGRDHIVVYMRTKFVPFYQTQDSMDLETGERLAWFTPWIDGAERDIIVTLLERPVLKEATQ